MKEVKKINSDGFHIENNVISTPNALLQISNISQVSLEVLPKEKFGVWSVFAFLVGLAMVIQRIELLTLVGAIVIIIVVMYWICYIVEILQDEKGLCLYMNSGYLYCITSREDFLEKILEVIEYCINNHYMRKIEIDLINCKLYNSPLVMGNTNSAVVVGDNNSVIINDAEWKVLREELIKVYRKLPRSSEEYIASQKAYNCAVNRDEQGLKSVLKEYAKNFASDLFSGVASGVLVELISKLM